MRKVLSRQEYCGDVINFKTYSKSFKNKRRYDNAPENWMIFKDVHEAIIARENFEKVQARIAKTKRRAPKPHNGQKSIFADLLFCSDYHTKLRYHTNTISKDIHYFVCANNRAKNSIMKGSRRKPNVTKLRKAGSRRNAGPGFL